MEILSQQVSEIRYFSRDKLPITCGEWQPIDVENPHVQGLGYFAVEEHNKKTGKDLVFKNVVMGWKQVCVAGSNYRLIVVAEHGCIPNLYDAIVYEQPCQGFRELKSFKPLFNEESKPVPGGWQPIKDIANPHVQGLGQFAITEHNQQTGEHLEFIRVIKGWTQIVAGVNYRIIILAKDGWMPHIYDAIVWEKPWEGFRQLTSFKRIL